MSNAIDESVNLQHLTRQWELVPLEAQSEPITIIGAGAVGSVAALALAKMGFYAIDVWDHDKVEVENIGVQFYRFRDIGEHKVSALASIVEDFTGVKLAVMPEKFLPESKPGAGIVVLAVDNMAVRKSVYETYRARGFAAHTLIDPRMGAETALVYTCKLHDKAAMNGYAKSLYTDEAAVFERCTAKATMYTALSLGALVAQLVKDRAMKREIPKYIQWSLKDYDFTAVRPPV